MRSSGTLFIYALLVIALFLYIGHWLHGTIDDVNKATTSPPLISAHLSSCNDIRNHGINTRIKDYCGRNTDGSEGVFSGVKKILLHVSLVIRHGDRMSINGIENSKFPIIDNIDPCHNNNSSLIQYHKHRVQSFGIASLSGNVARDALNIIAQTDDNLLQSGELTSTGFRQHILLGQHLNLAYSKYLFQVDDSIWNQKFSMYIRSTNFGRTIQSAAGLISAFLGSEVPLSTVNISISAYSDIWEDNMLGAANNFNTRHNYDKRALECPKFSHYENEMSQKGYKKTSQNLVRRISDLFGDTVAAKYTTTQHISDLVDSMLVSSCHSTTAQNAFPCGGNQECVTPDLMADLMDAADDNYCASYNSTKGGIQFTRLAMYPFMKELLNRMLGRTALHQNNIDEANSPHVAIYSGHDTVIGPVLGALGVFGAEKYCKWPGYASRIAFELWASDTKKQKSNDSSDVEYFIRVVYNGDDVTQLVDGCQTSEGKRLRSKEDSLCPLDNFIRAIDNFIYPFHSYNEACK